jgi:putative transposase
MGKPYSIDLRERAVRMVEIGGLSRHEVARRLEVGVSSVIRWVHRLSETGSLAPGQMGGHKPKAIRGEHDAWLRQRIKAGDFTLRGLVVELATRGLKVDCRSVWAFVHAEQLSFKKNDGGWRARSSRRRTPARAMG